MSKKVVSGTLRQKAEELHKIKVMDRSSPRSEADYLKLLHELEVHQIKLEMQNEELISARAAQSDAFEKYIELYDFAPSGYLTLNESRRIEEINLTGAGMLGKDRSDLINSRFDLFVSPESLPVFNDFFEKVFNSAIKKFCEVTIINKGEVSIYVELTGIAAQDRKNCQVIMNDITVHKKAEQILINAKELAETSDRLKSAFLSTMSHELRTPLNSIIGFSGILLHGSAGQLNEEQAKQVGMIQKSGRHLLSLISDILDMSKIESGQLSVNYELFNIQDIIEDIIRLQAPSAMTKELTFNFDRTPDRGEIVSDRQWVYQALLNVIHNAIKFSEKGSVTVHYSQDTDFVTLKIVDTGIGIKEEDLAILFHPFSQADNSLTRTHHGSGLGLSISRKLIEMLGGTISVKSEIGKGSTFTITLPVDEEKKMLYQEK